MATPTRKRRPARKTGVKTTKPESNGTATTGRNRADEATVEKRRVTVRKRVLNGGESAATVAKDLGITPGKAAFIAMQLKVEDGDVPAITGRNEDALLKAVNVARNKADEHSSWGWLSARSGISESSLKSKMTEAGFDVAGTQIASVRKTKNGNGATKKAAPKKTTAKTGKSTRTRTRRPAADPS
jgi:hypothetical protein